MRKLSSFVEENIVVYCVALAIVLTFIIEILNRSSLIGAVQFVYLRPVPFLCNVLIILTSFLIVIYLKRRMFALFLLSTFWLLLGIVNFIVMMFRQTPFSAVDIEVFMHASSIAGAYLTTLQVIMIVSGAVALIAFIVYMFIKLPKKPRVSLAKCLPATAVSVLLMTFVVTFTVRTGTLKKNCDNLIEAYDKYGFTACFALSIADKGVTQPSDYDESTVLEILSGLDPVSESSSEKPNFIFIQLESFFDPYYFNDVTFSEDPVPNFRKLRDTCPSGFLSVSTIGGGTINTEFEVLTGLSLDYFGLGETPFITVLRTETCESLAYDLRSLGYTSFSLHDNTATFYDRNTVYAKLGFDTFIPVEYMQNTEYNALGWVKDSALQPQIRAALESTEGRDFIFTITVQSHGKYPTVDGDFGNVKILYGPEAPRRYEMEYYVNQLKAMDDFIAALIAEYSDYPEPVCMVFYGDHMPALDIVPEELSYGDIYKTEYVIWTNYDPGVDSEDEDLPAYRLSSKVLSSVDVAVPEATVINYHSQCFGKAGYKRGLNTIQYDILYGQKYAYQGRQYNATDLEIGLIKPEISYAEVKDGMVYVYGNNFTRSSIIYFNDWLKGSSTEYINATTLRVKPPMRADISESMVAVWQVCTDNTVFGKTPSVPLNKAKQ